VIFQFRVLFDRRQSNVTWSVICGTTMFEIVFIGQSPTKWQVRNLAGTTIMFGFEKTRRAARYQAERGLFLLLAAKPLLGDRP
jgi:hypothetical protein